MLSKEGKEGNMGLQLLLLLLVAAAVQPASTAHPLYLCCFLGQSVPVPAYQGNRAEQFTLPQERQDVRQHLRRQPIQLAYLEQVHGHPKAAKEHQQSQRHHIACIGGSPSMTRQPGLKHTTCR